MTIVINTDYRLKLCGCLNVQFTCMIEGSPTKILYTILLTLICATFTAHLILLYFSTRTRFGRSTDHTI